MSAPRDPNDRNQNDPNPNDGNSDRRYAPTGGGHLSTSLDLRVAGVLFGLFAAMLNAAPLTGVPFTTALPLFSAVPVFYLGFARGPLAAAIAALVAVAVTALAANPLVGLALAALTVVPAAYGAFLANLARPAEELGGPSDGLAWYPLADVLFRLCLAIALGVLALGLATGFDVAGTREATSQAVVELGQNPDLTPEARTALDQTLGGALTNADARDALAASVAALTPFFSSFLAVLVIVANLHLAMRLARARGVLARPADDMAIALRLPALALLVFGVALALAFTDGTLGVLARVLAGALGAGFTIAGYAILHFRLRGSALRAPVLIAVYVATALFALPALAMLGLGLFSTARAVPISKPT